MKIAVVRPTWGKAWASVEIWVSDEVKIGDFVKSNDFGDECLVIGLKHHEQQEPETQSIAAMDLSIGDELQAYGHVRITGLNKEQGIRYIYVDSVSIETGYVNPSIKILKDAKVIIKSRKIIMSLNLQNAIEECRALEKLLYSHLELSETLTHPDGTISLSNSNISIGKDVLVKASRDTVRASASKLSEFIKKV